MPYQEVFEKQYTQKCFLPAISIPKHHALNYKQ
jgi:hypothetical protein